MACSPPSAGGLDSPHVKLQDAFADGAAGIGLVDSLCLGHLDTGLERSIVDGLEDVAVERLGLRG